MKKFFFLLAVIILSLPVYSQPNVKESIDEMKAKLNNFQKTLAEIKANTNNLSDVVKNMKDKTNLLSDDFFTPEFLSAITESSNEFKQKMALQSAGRKKFYGPGNNCNPGTECFKFKKEIGDLFKGIEKLNATLLGPKIASLAVADKFSKLIDDAPNMGLYMAYEAVGPLLKTINKEVTELTAGLTIMKADLDELASVSGTSVTPTGIRGKGPSFDSTSEILLDNSSGKSDQTDFMVQYEVQNVYEEMNIDNPASGFNSEITTMQLSNFCSKDRSGMAKVETTVEIGVILVQFVGKLIQEFPEASVEAGGSFVGHAALEIKPNTTKGIGIFIESAGDIGMVFLDRWKSAIDDCDTQRNQKIVLDNQKILLENQALLFQELEKIK